MSKKIKCNACGTLNYSSDVYCRKCNGTLYEKNHLNEEKAKKCLSIFSS